MAFVSAPFLGAGATSFSGSVVCRRNRASVASIRMAEESETSSSEVGVAGKSMWKENFFTGGFPGGEQFFQAWAEDGMTKDVPDMPASMQPSVAFKAKKEKKKGLLARLDATEFFKGFGKKSGESSDEAEAASGDASEAAADTGEPAVASDAPSPALYEAYYPEDRRNLAPDIKIVYEKDFAKDRVYMAMTEVTASPVDVYFPKERKNKAPMITVSYKGSLASAFVKVALEEVEGLPTIPPPPKQGDAVTELVPGRGGGLKLQYTVAGEGPVEI